jgi:hypothetical protein
VSSLQAAVPVAVSEIAAQHEAVAPAGLELLGYEGGQGVYNRAEVVNSAPEMYDIHTAYLDGMEPYFPLFMHYLHNGQWSSGGAWGAAPPDGRRERDRPRLLREAPESSGVVAQRSRQQLDGHVALEPRVVRPPHLAHGACAQSAHDLVWPHACAWPDVQRPVPYNGRRARGHAAERRRIAREAADLNG